MAGMKIANFESFILSHLARDLHQKLIISRVACKKHVHLICKDP